MKRIFASAVAAAAMASAAPSYAADFILTDDALIDASPLTFSNFYLTTPGGTSAVLTNTIGNTSPNFVTDNFFFSTLVPESIGSGSATTDTFQNLIFDTPGLTITGYTLTNDVFNDLLTAFTTGDVTVYNQAVADVAAYAASATSVFYQEGIVTDTLQRRLDNVPLFNTNFYKISITAQGSTDQSSYSGTLSSTAVPEPTTWAMMLVGFGAIGFAMRRRRQSHPKVRFAF